MFLKGLLFGLGWTTGAMVVLIVVAGLLVFAERALVARKNSSPRLNGSDARDDYERVVVLRKRFGVLYGSSRWSKVAAEWAAQKNDLLSIVPSKGRRTGRARADQN